MNNMSTIQVVDWVLGDGIPVKVIMAIHDSIMLEVPVGIADYVAEQVVDIMTQWSLGEIPIVVDVEAGKTWGSMTADRSKWAA